MKLYPIIFLLLVILSGCNKQEFLEKKPNDALVVPTNINELQALLDNDIVMNGTSTTSGLTPAIGDAGTDDFFVLNDSYNSLSEFSKNIYTWNETIFLGSVGEDISWVKCYKGIFTANVVLDGLEKIKPSERSQQWKNTKGAALFYRSFLLWQIAILYSPAFDKANSTKMLGVPLRISSDINEPITRSSQAETYSRIIEDLLVAKDNVIENSLYKTQPSLNAVYSLLARVYLSMNDYDNAYLYADVTLKRNSTLFDFNSITGTSTTASVIPAYNSEMIFFSLEAITQESLLLGGVTMRVDTTLYNSYNVNDLRKKVYFRARVTNGVTYYSFRGSYSADAAYFSGLANDENYLIRAECLARKGQIDDALSDLNTLLKARYTRNTYTNQTATGMTDALNLILKERRKELLFRGIRWSDIKRLNKEGQFTVIPARRVNNLSYTLAVNSPRYTYPIPQSVISFNPNMPQNDRK